LILYHGTKLQNLKFWKRCWQREKKVIE